MGRSACIVRTVHGGEPVRPTMKGRLAMLARPQPVVHDRNDRCSNRSVPRRATLVGARLALTQPCGLDGPEPEDTPMKLTYQGNAIVEIEVSYVPAHLTSRAYGVVVIELFEQWAPITTENMVTNVERRHL